MSRKARIISAPTAVRVAAAISIVVALLLASGAVAKDSNAPKEATKRWLPCEPWVMYHWIPFDSEKLRKRLGVTRAELKDWVRIENVRPLDQLARKQGLDPAALREELIEPWTASANEAKLAILRDHTDRMLTQGHLASHMLFHTFHHTGFVLSAKSIFGIPMTRYLHLRLKNRTNRDLGRSLGISAETLKRRAMATARRYANRGVAAKQMSPSEAKRFEKTVKAGLAWWLHHRLVSDKAIAGDAYRKLGKVKGREQRACHLFAGDLDAKHQESNTGHSH